MHADDAEQGEVAVVAPSYEELERAIASVPGVVEASVGVAPETGRGRLRIRLAPGEDPEAVSWAVAATLRERFGIALDPDDIRARTAAEPGPGEEEPGLGEEAPAREQPADVGREELREARDRLSEAAQAALSRLHDSIGRERTAEPSPRRPPGVDALFGDLTGREAPVEEEPAEEEPAEEEPAAGPPPTADVAPTPTTPGTEDAPPAEDVAGPAGAPDLDEGAPAEPEEAEPQEAEPEEAEEPPAVSVPAAGADEPAPEGWRAEEERESEDVMADLGWASDLRAAGTAAARRRRAAIRNLTIHHALDAVEAIVTLRLGERVAQGQARGVPTQLGVLRVVAEATVKALSHLTDQQVLATIDDVAVTPADGPESVRVVVTVLDDGTEHVLLGAALVRGDLQRAVMRATLDALNRRLEPVMVALTG